MDEYIELDFGTDWSHAHENQVVLVMSSFGTSSYDITFDRINVELIPYVQALIGMDFEHWVTIWAWFPKKSWNMSSSIPVIKCQLKIRYGFPYGFSKTNLYVSGTNFMGKWFKIFLTYNKIEPVDKKTWNQM